jgi:hypothetical protein
MQHKLGIYFWFLFVSEGSLRWMAKAVNGERRVSGVDNPACFGQPLGGSWGNLFGVKL